MTLVVRPYSEGDEFAINDAFNRIFGCKRPIEEWVWKFSVDGAREATAAAWDGESLAAHNGGIPADFEVGGRRVLSLQGVDTFSLAALDKRRDWKTAWLEVMDFFADIIAPQVQSPLLYGFTGPNSIGHMVKRCRWDAAEPRRIPLLTRAAGRGVAKTLASRLYVARPFGDNEPALDLLWATVRERYSAAIVRDADGIRRRFAGHPLDPYHRWLVTRRLSQVPVAFVVFRTDGGVCRWADLLWDARHPGALDLVQHLSSRLAVQTGCGTEAMWLDGDPEAEERLRGAGFDGGPDPSGVVRVVRFLDSSLSGEAFGPGQVYTTMADADLV
ncbi:MAG: hypothetical protein KAJ78_00940 [Acidobacteria bacterium]|nr:hypothetical protein [Acidobacteriota bacterium]